MTDIARTAWLWIAYVACCIVSARWSHPMSFGLPMASGASRKAKEAYGGSLGSAWKPPTRPSAAYGPPRGSQRPPYRSHPGTPPP